MLRQRWTVIGRVWLVTDQDEVAAIAEPSQGLSSGEASQRRADDNDTARWSIARVGHISSPSLGRGRLDRSTVELGDDCAHRTGVHRALDLIAPLVRGCRVIGEDFATSQLEDVRRCIDALPIALAS